MIRKQTKNKLEHSYKNNTSNNNNSDEKREGTTESRKDEETTVQSKINENSITIAELAQLRYKTRSSRARMEKKRQNMAIRQAQEPSTTTIPGQTSTRSKPRRNQQTKRKS